MDGDEDIIAINGHALRFPVSAPVKQLPWLLTNEGRGDFRQVTPAACPYFTTPHSGRGLAVGDVDNDGDLDLAISHNNEPVSLLRNETSNRSSWVSFHLIGRISNRDAVGAQITLHTPSRVQTRQIKGGGSYLSQNDLRPIFGLGQEAQIDRVSIRWPSGLVQDFRDIKPNRRTMILEPKD